MFLSFRAFVINFFAFGFDCSGLGLTFIKYLPNHNTCISYLSGNPYYVAPPERPFLEEVGKDAGRLKIGFLSRIPDGWNETTDLHPDCLAAVRDAARLCESLGRLQLISGEFY